MDTITTRRSLGALALIAWATLLGVTLVANARFGYSLGATETEARIMAAGAVASDLLKGLCPLAFFWFLFKGRWWPATTAAAVGLVTMLFSLAASSGFMAGERYRAFYTQSDKAAEAKAAKKDLERIETKRDWLPQTKPLTVLEAEMRGILHAAEYKASAYCTAAKTPAQVDFCNKVRQLEVDVANAKANEKADEDVKAARKEARAVGSAHGDAQVDFIKYLLGKVGVSVTAEGVLMSLVLLGVLLLELGSSFGLTIALSLMVGEESEVGKALAVVRPKKAPPTVPAAEHFTVKPKADDRPISPASVNKPDGAGFQLASAVGEPVTLGILKRSASAA